jgi:hypothetical protein
MRKERTFMHNWQRALKDIKESIKLSAKLESDVLKFDAKDWVKWFKSIDNFFRRTLGVRGVTLNWIYREEAQPKPGVKYASIAAQLKATLLLEEDHFDEDSRAVYDVVASSTLGTSAYSYVKKFEKTCNGRLALLALKLQFGGEAYDLSRSNAANEVIKIQDVPKQFDAESAHAIIDRTGTLRMPLEMSGVISYLPMRRPTDEELETCVSYDRTSDVPWEPYSPSFREREQQTAAEAASRAPADSTGPASMEEAKPLYMAVDHMDVDPFDDGYLLEWLIDSVRLTDDNMQRMIASVQSVLNGGSESPMEGAEGAGNRAEGAEDPGREEPVATRSVTQPLVSTESLTQKWQIRLDKAQATLRATTQTGLRMVINPLARQYTTRLPHLRYPVVKKTLYSDTMFSQKTKSLQQHTCVQVFTEGAGFTHTYPLYGTHAEHCGALHLQFL